MVFLILYVDDILIIGNDVESLTLVKVWLTKQFQMKDLGEASYVLGIWIFQDRKNKMLALSQASYLDKILEKYCMQDSKNGQQDDSTIYSCMEQYIYFRKVLKLFSWNPNFPR